MRIHGSLLENKRCRSFSGAFRKIQNNLTPIRCFYPSPRQFATFEVIRGPLSPSPIPWIDLWGITWSSFLVSAPLFVIHTRQLWLFSQLLRKTCKLYHILECIYFCNSIRCRHLGCPGANFGLMSCSCGPKTTVDLPRGVLLSAPSGLCPNSLNFINSRSQPVRSCFSLFPSPTYLPPSRVSKMGGPAVVSVGEVRSYEHLLDHRPWYKNSRRWICPLLVRETNYGCSRPGLILLNFWIVILCVVYSLFLYFRGA